MVEEVTVRINLEIDDDSEQAVKERSQEIKDTQTTEPDFELPESDEDVTEGLLGEQKQNDNLDKIEKLDTSTFSNFIGSVRDPGSFVAKGLESVQVLAPFIALFTFALTLPQTIQSLVNILKSNRILGVFRRIIQDEQNPYLTREQQLERRLGRDKVIFTNTIGFESGGGILSTNTLTQVRANGITNIGLRDRQEGLN